MDSLNTKDLVDFDQSVLPILLFNLGYGVRRDAGSLGNLDEGLGLPDLTEKIKLSTQIHLSKLLE